MADEISELKPCPFCGGEADIFENQGESYPTYCIVCPADTCGYALQDDFYQERLDGKNVVLRKWNTRPIEDALRQRVAELEGAIRSIDSAYKWYNEDSYENCISVVGDAIYYAMQKIKGVENDA